MSNEAKHTPGPLKLAGQHIITEEGGIIAYLPEKTEWNGKPGVLRANGKLFASAPALMDALGDLLVELQWRQQSLTKGEAAAITRARAAIAKASN